MSDSFLVLSDLHLAHTGSAPAIAALTALLREHPGRELVLAGDIFGLSSDPSTRDPIESVSTLVRAHPELRAALREHLARGGRVTLLAGNHDAALAHASMRPALLAVLDLTDTAPLALDPWFIRRGSVHVEHGHLWDPDNAPAHPLAVWNEATEPLGISLTRRFVAPREVYQFAHAHETTLVRGLVQAYRFFGPRMPLLVVHYFAASSRICGETLFDRGLSRERREGDIALARLSGDTGLPESVLRELVAAAPQPTHTAFQRTFLRLYYDRVLAAAGVGTGLVLAAFGAMPVALALAVPSGSYLALNVKQSGARYQNRPVRLLQDGAARVRQITGASLVIFGHTHVPAVEPGYANAGSFGYPGGPGRPYLWIENEQATLRRFTK